MTPETSITNVVNELLSTGSLYEDLITTLRTKQWTPAELTVAVPELRRFFKSHQTFAPSQVLAWCPNIISSVVEGNLLFTAMQHDTAGPFTAAQVQRMREGNVGAPKLPKNASTDSIAQNVEGMDDPSDQDSLHSESNFGYNVDQGDVQKQAMLQLEDEFVAILLAVPDQRLLLTKTHLMEAYRDILNKEFDLSAMGISQKRPTTLVRAMTRVRRSKIVGKSDQYYMTLVKDTDSFITLAEVERDLVELLKSLPDKQLRCKAKCIGKAYWEKYHREVDLAALGFFDVKGLIKAMTKVKRSSNFIRVAPPFREAAQLANNDIGASMVADIPQSDIPRIVAQELHAKAQRTYNKLCKYLTTNGPSNIATITKNVKVFRHYVLDYAKKHGFEYISFPQVLVELPNIEQYTESSSGRRLYRYCKAGERSTELSLVESGSKGEGEGECHFIPMALASSSDSPQSKSEGVGVVA